MKRNLIVVFVCLVIALVCFIGILFAENVPSISFKETSGLSKRADLPEYLNHLIDDPYYSLMQDDTYSFRISGETIVSVQYYADGHGDVISTVTVYADTIIVANPNAVILFKEIK